MIKQEVIEVYLFTTRERMSITIKRINGKELWCSWLAHEALNFITSVQIRVVPFLFLFFFFINMKNMKNIIIFEILIEIIFDNERNFI